MTDAAVLGVDRAKTRSQIMRFRNVWAWARINREHYDSTKSVLMQMHQVLRVAPMGWTDQAGAGYADRM